MVQVLLLRCLANKVAATVRSEPHLRELTRTLLIDSSLTIILNTTIQTPTGTNAANITDIQPSETQEGKYMYYFSGLSQ